MKTLLRDADREGVLQRISGIRTDSPRQWGRMSPGGMICHLTDAFAGCLGDLEIQDRSTFAGRTIIRFIAATVPLKWPQGVPTLPEADQERDGTPPGELEADVARLVALTHDFVERVDPRTMRHPLFGKLSKEEWGRWGYRHIDHHARQFGL